MVCDECKNDFNSLTFVDHEGKSLWVCTSCRDKLGHKPRSIVDFKNRMTLSNGKTIGVGHYHDLLARKKDPESGKIYRDTGKKFI